MPIRIRVRTNDPDASDEQIKAAAMAKLDRALDNFGRVFVAAAKGRAPVGKDRPPKSGRKSDMRVVVEIGENGVPRIAPGSRKSAAASRYIKTKRVEDMRPLGGGFYEYTFRSRSQRNKQHGRLRDSIHALPATNGKLVVKVDAPYAWPVEHGHRTPGTRRVEGQWFLWNTIQELRGMFESGEFLGIQDEE